MNSRLRSKNTDLTPKYRKAWKHIEAHNKCPYCSKLLTKIDALDIRTYGQMLDNGTINMAYCVVVRCTHCQEILLPQTYKEDWSPIDQPNMEKGISYLHISTSCSACQKNFSEDGAIKYQGYGQLHQKQDVFQINKVSVLCDECDFILIDSYRPSVLICGR